MQLPESGTEGSQPTPTFAVAQATSQSPNEEGTVNQESNSNELFESVERSLSDLQLINHCDSNENSSSATNAPDVLSAIAPQGIGESTLLSDLITSEPEPAVAAEPQVPVLSELTQPQPVLQQDPPAEAEHVEAEHADAIASEAVEQTYHVEQFNTVEQFN